MIRGVFFVIMQWKALDICQLVTAIFPPQKSGKGIAAKQQAVVAAAEDITLDDPFADATAPGEAGSAVRELRLHCIILYRCS